MFRCTLLAFVVLLLLNTLATVPAGRVAQKATSKTDKVYHMMNMGQCINQHILKMKYFEFLVETESRSVSFCDGRERLWGLRRVRWRRHINCQLSENRWREKSFPDKFQNYSRRHRLGIQHWPISVCFVFSQVLFSQFNRLPVICCKFRLVH